MKSFSSYSEILSSLIKTGVREHLSHKEKKRIILLNKLCLLGVIVNLYFSVHILLAYDALPIIKMHLIGAFVLIAIIFLQKYGLYVSARVSLWVFTYFTIFVFSKFLKTDINNDYYFAIVAVLPLLFFDSRIVTVSALIISCIGFFAFEIRGHIMGTYVSGEKYLNSSFILFSILYLIVDYFKRLNEKNEKAIETQHKELAELNEFQSHFFVNVSHELRTPLTLIQGSNDKLMSLPATQYNQDIKSIGTAIDNQSNKIKRIVDDVIDLAKMEVSKFKPVFGQLELSGFMKQLYHSFHSSFQHKGIVLDLELDIPATIIEADTVHFERALNNIMLNALKYTSQDGKVILRAVKGADEKSVAISIQDTGVGISTDELGKVFNRFYQADNDINKAGGSGVGLAFSREVINLHNGDISVKSKLGEGTTFLITIPVVSYGVEIANTDSYSGEGSHERIVTDHIPSFNDRPDYCILIVDDHEEMRDYIKSLLHGYRCIEASNGLEALETLKEHKVDYIITDYMMPKMDGYEFISQVKEKGIHVPILMLSARSDIEGRLNVLRLGIDDYLTKPFHKAELQIRISNALNNYQAMTSQHQNNIDDEKKEDSLTLERSEEDLEWLKILQAFAEKNCHRADFGLSDLTMEFAMSQSTMYRKLKSLTGLSPNEFMREVKLQYARTLLEEKTYGTVKQLAYAVGFQKPSHFSNLYEKRFGSRPVLFT